MLCLFRGKLKGLILRNLLFLITKQVGQLTSEQTNERTAALTKQKKKNDIGLTSKILCKETKYPAKNVTLPKRKILAITV